MRGIRLQLMIQLQPIGLAEGHGRHALFAAAAPLANLPNLPVRQHGEQHFTSKVDEIKSQITFLMGRGEGGERCRDDRTSRAS